MSKIARVYEGELLDAEASRKKGEKVCRRCLMVSEQVDEFSTLEREIVSDDKKSPAYADYLTALEFEKFKASQEEAKEESEKDSKKRSKKK